MELTLAPVLRRNAGTAPEADGEDGTLGGALYRHQNVVDDRCDVPLLGGMCLCAIPTTQMWFGASRPSCIRIQGVFQDW